MNKVSKDPRSEEQRRHNILDVTLSRNIKNAVIKSNIDKRAILCSKCSNLKPFKT